MFSEQQKPEIDKVLQKLGIDINQKLGENEIRLLLNEFEIDESFAPALRLILSNSQCEDKDEENGDYSKTKIDAAADIIINFFNILTSGEIKDFFRMLFKAIDRDNDGELDVKDINYFGNLVGENISEEEAKDIMQSDINNDGKVAFEDFWRWYQNQRGFSEDPAENSPSKNAKDD